MSIQATETLWMDGELIPWADAKVHVMSHALHYGSSVFEGIRVYATPDGPKFFRLRCHSDRLLQSARIHRMDVPYDAAALDLACAQVVAANRLPSAYVRPLLWRGFGSMGLDPTESPVQAMVLAIEWGAYLGSKALEEGIDVCVSSWARLAPNTLPTIAKAGGQYIANTTMLMEAKRNGYAEAIALNTNGTVSEGSGENLFVVVDGVLYTPGWNDSILMGITRHSVLTLAKELGCEIQERPIPREVLYSADEVFLTGTAAEITPVRSVDRIPVGAGEPGPLTRRLQQAFFGLFDGSVEDRHGWLTGPGEYL
jgi:branched-chain amino acid aminotransferase